MYSRPPPILPKIREELKAEIHNYSYSSSCRLCSPPRRPSINIRDALPVSTSDPVHPFQPGDSVWVKKFTTQGLTPALQVPHTVILTTPTAVKVNDIPTWVHHSRLKGGKQNGRSRPLQTP
uniref:Murine leukemia virus integrase C-terminal domain-containing protein n=1 Tax=Molossus molossus TaxID=27622 RepID=A0A7J8HHS0_MOLMO|nr:hypothetical protein HJG59_010968 [Molossus molossus]